MNYSVPIQNMFIGQFRHGHGLLYCLFSQPDPLDKKVSKESNLDSGISIAAVSIFVAVLEHSNFAERTATLSIF